MTQAPSSSAAGPREEPGEDHDPLATATVAQLYLRQGHVRQAVRTLRDVLARDPGDPLARVLQRRLSGAAPRVEFKEVHGALEARAVGAPQGAHIIVVIHRREGGVVRSWCESRRVPKHVRIPTSGQGAASVCVATFEDGVFRVVAAGSPVRWPAVDAPNDTAP